MHPTLYAASAIALAIGFSGGARALTLLTPPAAPVQAFEMVADVAATIATESAPLRDKADLSGKILERLPRGTKVTIKEKDPTGQWLRVTVHGMEGYVDRRQVGVTGGQYQ
jgi:uncharacterized protein YgiM (DUF1202 family)